MVFYLFDGKFFVVFGVFFCLCDEIKVLIEVNGGKNVGFIFVKMDYVLVGENMGFVKLEKVMLLGIIIFFEVDFDKMF